LPVAFPAGKNKMDILKVDPYLPMYAYEKETNPDSVILLRQFRKRVVDAVDRIVELAHGKRETVGSEKDWRIVEELFSFFAHEWPEEYMEFKKTIEDIRHTRNEGGYSDSKEIKYVGAIPPRFERLVKAIFPLQQWDKKFANKFVKRIKILNVGGEVQ
jgi:hypothetical protein